MRGALYLIMLLSILLLPGRAAEAARNALSIWGHDVVPSLFPYMVLCRMLAAQLRSRRIPAAPVSGLLGMLGGSPSGASVLAAYARQLPRKTLLTLCALTGTISPMFLMQTVGGWMGSTALGCRLLIAHLIGAAFAALCVYLLPERIFSTGLSPAQSVPAGDDQNPVAQSVNAILSVGGFIIFYSVIAELLSLLSFIPASAGTLLHALLEAAGGMHALSVASFPENTKAILLAAASGFSGLSILSQNLFFLRPFGMRMRDLVCFGFLRMLGAGCAMLLLLH